MQPSQPIPIIGEIRAFSGTRAPKNWMICDGALLEIAEYPMLFELIRNTYGGDRRNTFAIPDLRGRLIVQNGQLTGGANYRLGIGGGTESVTLTPANMARHQHSLTVSSQSATTNEPDRNFLAIPQDTKYPKNKVLTYLPYEATDATLQTVPLHPDVLASTGRGQSHENRQPFLCIMYIIAIQGIFPSFP
ncbi:MAG: tail fiber protein [Chitinophagaceae bacterium]